MRSQQINAFKAVVQARTIDPFNAQPIRTKFQFPLQPYLERYFVFTFSFQFLNTRCVETMNISYPPGGIYLHTVGFMKFMSIVLSSYNNFFSGPFYGSYTSYLILRCKENIHTFVKICLANLYRSGDARKNNYSNGRITKITNSKIMNYSMQNEVDNSQRRFNVKVDFFQITSA